MNGDPEQSEFLTVRDTARLLGVHENTVRLWANSGILKSSRPPGARFHRFSKDEVERVRRARMPERRSVRHHRRFIGPELLDATQLVAWSDTRQAQVILPQMIRRLLAATPGISDIHVRAGEGIAIGGWDGLATSSNETQWLPEGQLGLELSVASAPAHKAQADFDKRTKDPLGLDPANAAFVFVTTRRWRDGPRWAAARQADGPWRQVRVLDADDLEGWLDFTPAVHYWISEVAGLEPRDVRSGEQWWSQFSKSTHPTLPAGLFLAGRKNEADELRSRLDGPPDVVSFATPWDQDALAFICAALGADLGDDNPDPPILVVQSPTVWGRVVEQAGPAVLVPTFTGADISAAIGNEKHVVLAAGADDIASRQTVSLPRPERQAATEALREAGLDPGDADRLAGMARRSMKAAVRRMSTHPRFNRPDWARPPASEIFGPLVLVGSWEDTTEDQRTVSELLGRPWFEIEQAIRWQAITDDPAVVRAGDTWRMAAREEAFEVLKELISPPVLSRWETLVQSMLFTSMHPAMRSDFSPSLREGLVRSLALIASHGSERLSNNQACAETSKRVVESVLSAAARGSSTTLWRNLAWVLPAIAEAAPSAFLMHVDAGTQGEHPRLADMFRDGTEAGGFSQSSPHTGLLWALETLCWSEDYLVPAARLLARLDRIDPGGTLGNRPAASLSSVLVLWTRHTKAEANDKLAAVEAVIEESPATGWKLLASLWPSLHSTAMPPHEPRFQDWKPDHRHVSVAEYSAAVEQVVALSIREAGEDSGRWAELIGRVGPLPQSVRDTLLEAIDRAASRLSIDPAAGLTLWEALTQTVNHHRSFPEAKWAMQEATVGRLEEIAKRIEPPDNVEGLASLFDWSPALLADPEQTPEEQSLAIAARREEAVLRAIDLASFDGLARIADRAAAPSELGRTIAAVTCDTFRDELLAWLDRGVSDKRQETSWAWLMSRAREQGPDWVAALVETTDNNDYRLLALLAAGGEPAIWKLASSLGLEESYWERVSAYQFNPAEVPAATEELIAHNRGPTAVKLLTAELYRPVPPSQKSLSPDLVSRALESIIATRSQSERNPGLSGYEIAQLLDYLQAESTDPSLLVKFEFAFFDWLDQQREPKAINALLASSPEFFADLVSTAFRAHDDQSTAIVEPEYANRAALAWRVLRSWRTLPGSHDGVVDPVALRTWVDETRARLAATGRADVGDEQIGEMLAGSPRGQDGLWPAEAVRDLVEALASQDLEHGLQIGRSNLRGFTSRGVYDGGDIERDLAASLSKEATALASKWPRTARLLHELAESYERDAQRWDDEGQARAGAD